MAATKIQSQYLAESVWLEVITQLFILQYGAEPWYRHVCAIGAVLNILMMMVANLIGFVIGVDGIRFFLSQVFGTLNGAKLWGL